MRHPPILWTLILTLVLPSLLDAAPQRELVGIPRNPGLVLEAKPTKLVYVKGEMVEFDFSLRNVSGSDLVVARWLQLTLNIGLEISDSQGRPVKWCGRIADELIPSKSRYVTLRSGRSLHAKLTLSCVHKEDARHAWGYLLDSPGKYVIKASYRLPQPKEFFGKLFPHANMIRGPVTAEPVTIEVK